MPPVVLITYTGRASRHLITTLLSLPDCPAIRVLASSDEAVQLALSLQLRSAPHSIVTIDHFHGRKFQVAFAGVSVVFHNGSTEHSQDEAASKAIIDTAKEAGVGHFVFCSVLHPMRVKLHMHKVNLSIEEYLVESRLNYTILQPAHYMQNIALDKVFKTGKLSLGYSSSVIHGFVDLMDVALIARNVILHTNQHSMARYELVSQNISYGEIAEVIAHAFHKDIQCDVLSGKEFIARMRMTGEVGGEFAEDAIERLVLYYDRWGLTGNSNVIQWLLGREPVSWEGYVRREVRMGVT